MREPVTCYREQHFKTKLSLLSAMLKEIFSDVMRSIILFSCTFKAVLYDKTPMLYCCCLMLLLDATAWCCPYHVDGDSRFFQTYLYPQLECISYNVAYYMQCCQLNWIRVRQERWLLVCGITCTVRFRQQGIFAFVVAAMPTTFWHKSATIERYVLHDFIVCSSLAF